MGPTGFFTLKQTESPTINRKQTCASCGLYKKVLSPRMPAFGNFKKQILVCGEGPGETEDRRNKQWQGQVGQALQKAFREFDVNLFEDCLSINAVNCRCTNKEGNNREPTHNEIAACRSRVLQVITEHKPKLIIGLGNASVECLVGHRWKKDLGTIGKWRGWTIPDRDFNAWLCFGYHPSYMERGEKEVETIFMQDLEHALSMVNKPLPKHEDETKQVEIISDLSILKQVDGPFAFDYETTGLKGHDKTRHRIVSMSVAWSDGHAVAFMMPTDPIQLKHIRRLLRSDHGAIASNMKFEQTWSVLHLGYEVKNWLWDTMLASHVLDNRQGISGLKFQVFVRFGAVDYSSEINEYLTSKDKKSGNTVNRIDELIKTEGGRRKLLVYNGMDSIFEYKLAMRQMAELEYNKI